MKTSTFFACGIPETEKDLHLAMISCLEAEEEFNKDYGLQKVWHSDLKEFIGVSGIVKRKRYNALSHISEGLIFLKSNHLGSGLGFWVERCVFNNLEKLNGIMIASVWEQNSFAIKLMKKNGMNFVKKTSKIYKDRTINIEVYIKPSSGIIVSKNILDNIEEYLAFNKVGGGL